MIVDSNFRSKRHKKNVDNYYRLRILRYRQTPMLPKRVKAHADWREHPSFTLAAFLNWRFQNTRL